MVHRSPPANRPNLRSSLQQRLLARLIAAIYGITEALIPIVETVAKKPVHPWQDRMRYADRFWAIIRELNALTIQIRPAILSEHPVFPPTRPKAARPVAPAQPATSVQPHKSPSVTPRPTRPITARQLAQRLAILLNRLERLAAEVGAALTAPLRRHAAQARAIAGCDACPPKASRCTASWERAG